MTTENSKFKDFLSKLPSSLQEEIEDAIEVSTPSSDISEDTLQMMKEMSPETYEELLKGIEILKNQPIEKLKVLFSTKQEKDFEFLDDEEEDIIVWQGNYHSEKNITFQNGKIIIINGNIACNNLIVKDCYLFVNGNVNCKVFFNASENDKMTQITLNLKAKLVVEIGHYTVVDGKIEAENIVIISSEIKSNTAIKAKVIFEETEYEKNKLNSLITDDKGYFDEEKFLEKINTDSNFNTFETIATNVTINLENVIKIIYSEIIPENNKNGYNLHIGLPEVCIKKPYIDADGHKMGNSIYIDGYINDYAIQFFINLSDDKKVFVTLYKSEDITKFEKLDVTVNLTFHNYFQYVFNLITEKMELLEKNE